MKKLITILFVLAVIGAGAGAYYMRRGGPPPEVMTVPVTRGDVVDAVGATGTLEAVTTVQVGTQVSGTIQQLYADFNSIVRQGQVIARLDPSLFETQVEQARANLVRAEADVERLRVSLDDARTKLQRAEGLAARNLIPQTELEAAQVAVRSTEAQIRSSQAQITQARASLNQSQVNLQHTVITSPIDGIVVSRNVDVGQTVAASMQAPTLFVLAADLTKMKVNAAIDEADVGRIRPGQRVRFRVDAYPTEEFIGTVAQVRLQPVVVQNVVTYATVIDVPNPELKLKPGMTATVNIEVARRQDVVRVPNTALRFRPTPDIFAALGQEPPPEPPLEMQRAVGGPGAGDRDGERLGDGAGGPQAASAGAVGASPPSATERAVADRPSSSSTASNSDRAAAARPQGERRARATNAAGQSTSASPGAGQQAAGRSESDPERRQQFIERMQRMSPEEREQLRQRMRERGGSAADAPETAAEPAERGRRENAPAAARSTALSGAQTIDSLFGPLPPTESTGRVWLFVNGQLKSVRLRLGVSDGTHTELLSGELQPGAELVMGVIKRTEARGASTGGGRSPLMGPQRGPGGMPGVRNPSQGGGGRR